MAAELDAFDKLLETLEVIITKSGAMSYLEGSDFPKCEKWLSGIILEMLNGSKKLTGEYMAQKILKAIENACSHNPQVINKIPKNTVGGIIIDRLCFYLLKSELTRDRVGTIKNLGKKHFCKNKPLKS